MQKQNKRRTRRIRNLIFICTMTAVVLSVSTYAWFIGMRTVNVSSFDVEIASTDSLLLSLDGESWDTTVNISEATLDADSYIGHTNNWGGRGLFPVSSVGDMDATASRMKLFEKASLTTTPGGYRLLVSRVNNYEEGDLEQDGYVAFDLFVKNFSGTQYIKELNELDEEDIYLTADSAVSVAADGVANTGIENSVRVAFAQIGRVAGTTNTPATITGITCSPTAGSDVTGVCRTAQIWEPNDTKHVVNAINWYNTSCLARTGTDVTLKASYVGNCGTVADGFAYPTYAASRAITSADNIDIYDGAEYNTYVDADFVGGYPITPYPFFTDTMKIKTGTERPTFMKFAPNSITKVRIYIYIEGQDVDNYDFASIGKKIAVKFGFTKERFTEDDIDYVGPDLNIHDESAPVITLNGSSTMTIPVGGTYTELGATAVDDMDGTISANIVMTGTVDATLADTYVINYNVSDDAGNNATQVTRTVIVE